MSQANFNGSLYISPYVFFWREEYTYHITGQPVDVPTGLVVICIDRPVDVCDGPYNRTHTIAFYGPDGNELEQYLYYYQHPDLSQSILEVKGPEDRLS